ESTVAGAPLYAGPLTALSDDDGRRALRADLLASGSPGSYYLELHAGRSPVAFLGTSTRENAEPSTLWIDGQERRGAGLALAVFGLQGEGSIVTERRLARRRPRPSW